MINQDNNLAVNKIEKLMKEKEEKDTIISLKKNLEEKIEECVNIYMEVIGVNNPLSDEDKFKISSRLNILLSSALWNYAVNPDVGNIKDKSFLNL